MWVDQMIEQLKGELEHLEEMEWVSVSNVAREALAGRFNTWPSGLQYSDQYLAAPKDTARTLDYYMGLEFLEEEERMIFGDMVFYSRDADRVEQIIAIIKKADEEAA